MDQPSRPYGLIAEYDSAERVIEAATAARADGYRRMDAYTPFPVHGLSEALGFEDNRVPWLIFLCGLAGAVGGLALQYYASVIAYPHNVGGRPLASWVSFVPVTFETTVLLAAAGAVVGMLAMNGLPRPHHPIFGARNIERASTDGFFLCIESIDPRFDDKQTAEFLRQTGALDVSEVPE